MNASPNLTDPYDPMAGTLARTAMQCAARGCDGCLVCRPASAAQVVQEGHKTAGGAGAAPDSFARAHVSPPLGLDVVQAGLFVPEAPAAAVNVCILALDLGTKTGFALRRRDGRMVHGTEEFTPRASWGPGQKWLRFRSWLSATITEHNITQIAFEDVKRHGPGQVLAAHAYGGFRAMLEMVADQHRVPLVPFGVGQIKKHWTGSGVAKKDDMVMQATLRRFRVVDDNNADALAILHLAIAKEGREWTAPPARPKTRRSRKGGAVAQERKA